MFLQSAYAKINKITTFFLLQMGALNMNYRNIAVAALCAVTLSGAAFAAETTTSKGLTDINDYWGKTAVESFYPNSH